MGEPIVTLGGFTITMRGPLRGLKRHHSRLMKSGFMAIGLHYHDKYSERHFTTAGALLYRYTPRSGEAGGTSSKQFFRSYTGQKQRQKGHRRPLVWSGASEVLAKITDVRATSRRGRVVQHARGLNRKHPLSDVDMGREIKTWVDDERRDILRVFRRTYITNARAIRAKKTVRG